MAPSQALAQLAPSLWTHPSAGRPLPAGAHPGAPPPRQPRQPRPRHPRCRGPRARGARAAQQPTRRWPWAAAGRWRVGRVVHRAGWLGADAHCKSMPRPAARTPQHPAPTCMWRIGGAGQPVSGQASAASAATSSAAPPGPATPTRAASASAAAAATAVLGSSRERRSSRVMSAACRAWCHTAAHSRPAAAAALLPSCCSAAVTAGGSGMAGGATPAMLGRLSASTAASRRSASTRCCGTLLRASRHASCTLYPAAASPCSCLRQRGRGGHVRGCESMPARCKQRDIGRAAAAAAVPDSRLA